MKKKISKKIEINDGHYHEIMDRCHIVMCNIDEHIIGHPGVDKEMKKLLIQALHRIYKVYCKAGNNGSWE